MDVIVVDEVVRLRVAGAEDERFLHTLGLATTPTPRDDGLSPAQRARLHEVEWHRAEVHRRGNYGRAHDYLIWICEQRVGRLWLAGRGSRELEVVELGLLPEWRGRGIGTTVMRWTMERAHQDGRSLVAELRSARVVRFYAHLGFEVVGRAGKHLRVERAW